MRIQRPVTISEAALLFPPHRSLRRALLLLVLAPVFFGLTACSRFRPKPATNFVYVTNTTDDTISGYSVTTNTTTPVTSFTALGSPSPYATLGGAPAAIAFDNTGTWMLAMNQTGPPDLIQYTVDTVVSPGRLYVTGSVFTGLSIVTASPGITMVTTH